MIDSDAFPRAVIPLWAKWKEGGSRASVISFNHPVIRMAVCGKEDHHGDLWLDCFLQVLQFLRRDSALLICVCFCFYSLSLVCKFLVLEDFFFLSASRICVYA